MVDFTNPSPASTLLAAEPSPGFSVTLRVSVPNTATATGDLVATVTASQAVLTALDVVESLGDYLTVDVSCDALGAEHMRLVASRLESLPGVEVRNVSDRTFLSHLGGKISVSARAPIAHRDDLARIYTPGVARVCEAIYRHPDDVYNLTMKRNTVAVVTDGSAVLGLGNLGAEAALPVMEGKAVLFKRFADVDAWPVCLATQDVDEIVRTVEIIAPAYGGINLEDIAAPRCFEIEQRLRASLDIPVFHDDQHGTAIAVLAALWNALALVGKRLEDARIVVSGVGAAGTAVIHLLLAAGATDIVASDRDGVLYDGKAGLIGPCQEVALRTNSRRLTGRLADIMPGADVFIGVSVGDLLGEHDVAAMAPDSIVFALANPRPEVDLRVARRHAAVVASGRSDDINQINNVLVFPGFFRGLLDARCRRVTTSMELAAARALASMVTPERRSASYIIPNVFDPNVVPAIARTVTEAARAEAV
ncbi:NAD-dependent malic enzyme [Acidiferrimicrobium sp. IK]|uniref:NAD-dependent malic enzyme n=1 Tax=Acidiferrimicrobium sp. IK TaxID=2871700 RepID=UPI0021CB09A7|nr:NAD-dependent malic enzyme [Acidiferrimicrobium sp. IK]MCU4187240.1 NAD-dependent malic enzyme [Acidiferrimicrobium sp. IK]